MPDKVAIPVAGSLIRRNFACAPQVIPIQILDYIKGGARLHHFMEEDIFYIYFNGEFLPAILPHLLHEHAAIEHIGRVKGLPYLFFWQYYDRLTRDILGSRLVLHDLTLLQQGHCR
jgi:hypothetical protein